MAPVVIADGETSRTTAMRWGFEPADKGRAVRFLVRDDSPDVDDHARCLIPATALPLTDRHKGRWMVAPRSEGALFCFPGLWKEASATWPRSYAAVTVPAYPDLRSIKRRHIAILPQSAWARWLAGEAASAILEPWPARSLNVVPL